MSNEQSRYGSLTPPQLPIDLRPNIPNLGSHAEQSNGSVLKPSFNTCLFLTHQASLLRISDAI